MATFAWPSSAGGGSSSNASVGQNGATAPTSSTEVAGINPSGNLQPLQTDSSGNLFVSALPIALQNVNLTQVAGVAVSLGSKVSASSFPVVIASDQTVPISAASLPLPAGAATSALQTTGNSVLGSILLDLTNGTQITQVTGTVAISAASLPLPTGAATSANQTSQITQETTTATNTTSILANQTNGTQVTSVSNFPATQTVSGTVIADAGTPAPLTIHEATLTVGLTAQRLTVSGSAPASTRVTLVGAPNASTTGLFYIGSSTVSTSSGIEIARGQSFIANNDAGDYWIVSDTAAQAVGIMEQY